MHASLKRLFRITNPPAGPFRLVGRHRIAWRRRLRLMMQHTWLIVIALVLLCAGVGGAIYHVSPQPPTHLRMAVGPPSGEDTRVVQAIAAQFARDRANIRLNTNVVAGGTREAAAAIDKGEADLAVVRRDTGMPKDGKVVAILRKNVVAFIVPSVPEPAKAGAKPAKGKAAAKAAPRTRGRKPRKSRSRRSEIWSDGASAWLGVLPTISTCSRSSCGNTACLPTPS